MPASVFQRKSLFFVIFSGVVIAILVIIPFLETAYQGYLLTEFGLVVTPDGKVVASDANALGMMTETWVDLVTNLVHIVKILLWMALVIAVVRYVGYLIFATALRHSSQSEIASLIRTVLSIIIYIVSFFIIFQSQYPRVELAPLFTGSTIIGIVVGLALQDTLGNLFAGIAMQADQPFQVGDVLSISNRGMGVVEGVSWRGVKIRTFSNKLLVISNSVIGKETIEVAPRGNLNARLVNFSTLYTESPTRVIQLVREAVRQVDNVSQKMRPVVRIREFGTDSIGWEVKYWADDYSKFNDTDALIRQRIWYLFNRERIPFPSPTLTIHNEAAPVATTREEYVTTASERLSHVPIFSPLSDEEVERLAKASQFRVYAPGEAIVRKGAEGNSMFVIVRGSVQVQLNTDSRTRTINELRSNDFFGEMSLLTGEPRTATVVAAEETEVLQIKNTALKPLFEANPELVDSVCEIIEERRALLRPETEGEADEAAASAKGVFNAIRNFFGLR
jgi:small-conductance mechanosensitive channel